MSADAHDDTVDDERSTVGLNLTYPSIEELAERSRQREQEDDDEDDEYYDHDDLEEDFRIPITEEDEIDDIYEDEEGAADAADAAYNEARAAGLTMDDEEAGEDGETDADPPRLRVTRRELLQLLRPLGNRILTPGFISRRMAFRDLGEDDEEDDDDDDSEDEPPYLAGRRGGRDRSGTSGSAVTGQAVSEAGVQLMYSGAFGTNTSDPHAMGHDRKKKKGLSSRILRRELGFDSGPLSRDLIKQMMIPSTRPDKIIQYESRCYSGQFSNDGDFFFSCGQDFKVRMYDTSSPYNWKHYKTVEYPFGHWTITDASLSPNNKFLAYSSIRRTVCLASTDPHNSSDPHLLDFVDPNPTGQSPDYMNQWNDIGIWSIRFSGDGRELVAGTNDNSIYVYDIEARKPILRIVGHKDDVNAVCYADAMSPHILYSGSDDTTIKVWDRRSMGDRREAGVFMGHTEGLTYVDSKGDGRYVLSNSKDQTMKLWDLRKMMSTEAAAKVDVRSHSTGFDYRFMGYHDVSRRKHPHDCSLVTFQGHRVLKTLIRCHFSPPGSTNDRYVYTGSEDGSVFIYNIDGTVAGKINVRKATKLPRRDQASRAVSGRYMAGNGPWKTCVRDASWHPNVPMIAATSWNGWGMTSGTCTVHSWDGGAEPEDDEEVDVRVDENLRSEAGVSGEDPEENKRFARSIMRDPPVPIVYTRRPPEVPADVRERRARMARALSVSDTEYE